MKTADLKPDTLYCRRVRVVGDGVYLYPALLVETPRLWKISGMLGDDLVPAPDARRAAPMQGVGLLVLQSGTWMHEDGSNDPRHEARRRHVAQRGDAMRQVGPIDLTRANRLLATDRPRAAETCSWELAAPGELRPWTDVFPDNP